MDKKKLAVITGVAAALIIIGIIVPLVLTQGTPAVQEEAVGEHLDPEAAFRAEHDEPAEEESVPPAEGAWVPDDEAEAPAAAAGTEDAGTAATDAADESAGATESAQNAEQVPCAFPQVWVNQPLNEDAIRTADRPYRILTPDAAATMDFSPDRLNIHVDENGIVRAVTCG